VNVYQLTSFATARLWYPGELPPHAPARSVETDVEANVLGSLAIPCLGLEACVPRGARIDYGLVGVTFEPRPIARVRVTVPYSETSGPCWNDSLAATLDDVSLGLAPEYAESLLKVIAERTTQTFPPGHLCLDHAAHGRVGSSRAFFGRLMTCVLTLLRDGVPGDAETCAFLRAGLVG
jgi:hypothetical protein